jgi:hypothetical protein
MASQQPTAAERERSTRRKVRPNKGFMTEAEAEE